MSDDSVRVALRTHTFGNDGTVSAQPVDDYPMVTLYAGRPPVEFVVNKSRWAIAFLGWVNQNTLDLHITAEGGFVPTEVSEPSNWNLIKALTLRCERDKPRDLVVYVLGKKWVYRILCIG